MATGLIVRDPHADYPPGWTFFDEYALHIGTGPFGFVGSLADVNRFAARYRAAKCFRELRFEGLSAVTVDGYTALTQVLLWYSAFEHLLRCIGAELRESLGLLSEEERARCLQRLRRLNGQSEFFQAIRQHLEPRYQRQIDHHHQSEPCNPFYLAAAIRHAYAHGKLAAQPSGVPQESVGTVCRFVTRLLSMVADREFSKRVNDVMSQGGGVDA